MNEPNERSFTLAELVERFGGELLGDPEGRVWRVATLECAAATDVSFFTNPKYRRQLEATRAGAVILARHDAHYTERSRIVSANPYAYFAKVSALLNPPRHWAAGVDPSASVHPNAQIDPTATLGAFVRVGEGARVGARTVIGAGCVLGDGVSLGADSLLHPRVVIYDNCALGDRVILHSGVVIGADGFGLAMDEGRWRKIPQVGRVLVGDDVEVGANTTIDRGAVEDTVIEEDVKLDNQIQIGHNCRIGAHTAIAGCVGIAGSTRIGRYCRIGGSAMIGGHLEIVDNVEISGAAAIAKSILKPGTYTALFPVSRHEDWLRNASHLRHLDALAGRIRELERHLAELERTKS